MTGIPKTNVSVNAGSVNVYVDGSCVGKGSDSAAGFGVWFGPYHELNFNCCVTDSEEIHGHRDTAQRAEIQAAQSAIRIAHNEKIFRLRIHSDCKYVLGSKPSKNKPRLYGQWPYNSIM